MYKFNGNSFIKNFIWILLFIRFIRSFAHALAATCSTCRLFLQCWTGNNVAYTVDDAIMTIMIIIIIIMMMLPRCNCRLPRFSPWHCSALPCPALPWQCPVCLGHKSKEQIAAAKAVKANKPKCRRNKLANVMDATRRGKYSRQGVECGATASGVVALLRSPLFHSEEL